MCHWRLCRKALRKLLHGAKVDEKYSVDICMLGISQNVLFLQTHSCSGAHENRWPPTHVDHNLSLSCHGLCWNIQHQRASFRVHLLACQTGCLGSCRHMQKHASNSSAGFTTVRKTQIPKSHISSQTGDAALRTKNDDTHVSQSITDVRLGVSLKVARKSVGKAAPWHKSC